MALDIAGLHDEAAHAYRWLVQTQRPDGSWFNYYNSDGSIEDAKLDTNVCAYIASGLWHHWLCTRDRAFVDELWPVVRRALDWVLGLQTPRGTIAVGPRGRRPAVGLRAAHRILLDLARPRLRRAPRPPGRRRPTALADRCRPVACRDRRSPDWFEPKDRWAMDWYYPILTGALVGADAKARLADGWDGFAMEGCGIRCVSDQPWVTAAETAECALSYAAIGDLSTASDLLRWTRAHRDLDGVVLDGHRVPRSRALPRRRAHRVHGRRRDPRRRRDLWCVTGGCAVRARPPRRLTRSGAGGGAARLGARRGRPLWSGDFEQTKEARDDPLRREHDHVPVQAVARAGDRARS